MDRIFGQKPPTDRQQILYMDAVETLLPAARLQYQRMQQAALVQSIASDNASSGIAESDKKIAQLALIADSGGFIGTVERLRKVVRRLRSDPELRIAKHAFEAEVRQFEEARHHLEHLDTAVQQIADTGHGVFGGISWWRVRDDKTLTCVLLVPGTLAVMKKAGVTRVPSHFDADVDHFWAVIAGADYYLTGAYTAVCRLEERLRAWAEKQSKAGWPALAPRADNSSGEDAPSA